MGVCENLHDRIKLTLQELTLRGGYFKHTLRQVANLFNKVILCIQGHAVMFIQVNLILSLVNGL